MDEEKKVMQLSENFSLDEMIKSQTAERKGIDNFPDRDHIESMKKLCENILQPIRDHYGRPFIVSSGYRCPELCLAIGSSIKSQHAKGQAADFEVPGISNMALAEYIKDNLEFDQLILEFYTPQDPASGWVHVSYNKEENRKRVLRAVKNDGKTVYQEGLT